MDSGNREPPNYSDTLDPRSRDVFQNDEFFSGGLERALLIKIEEKGQRIPTVTERVIKAEDDILPSLHEHEVAYGVGEEVSLFQEKSLLLLICQTTKTSALGLPFSRTIFESLAAKFYLPRNLLGDIFHGPGVSLFGHQRVKWHEHDIQNFMVVQASIYSLFVAYHSKTQSTVALAFTRYNWPLDRVTYDLVQGNTHRHWVCVPLTLFQQDVSYLADSGWRFRAKIEKLQESIKMIDWNDEPDKEHVLSVDYVDIIRRLNACSWEVAHFLRRSSDAQVLLSRIEQALGLEQKSTPDALSLPETTVFTGMRGNITYLQSWYEGLQGSAKLRENTVQLLFQTVLSMVSQRDNAVNLQISNESKKIAELSRQDNQAMRQVALAAARDSANMSVIAAVTLLFLPGTFIATFFSTSFFDFRPQGNDHVSRWIWLYAVIAVVMTFFVQGYWFLDSRRRMQDIQRKLEADS